MNIIIHVMKLYHIELLAAVNSRNVSGIFVGVMEKMLNSFYVAKCDHGLPN